MFQLIIFYCTDHAVRATDLSEDMVTKITIFLSLFYITFYIPFMLVSYNSSWYKLNCSFHDRCEIVGVTKAYKSMDQLTGFLLHNNDLTGRWTEKEKLHLNEVRDILDIMFIIAFVSVLLLCLFSNRKMIGHFSLINVVIIVIFFLILPFFAQFWRDVFHNLLFDNTYWLNTRSDLSYYITPRKFFKITVATVLSAWIVLNVLIRYLTKNMINNKA